MRLFHYTDPSTYLLIGTQGLLPQCTEDTLYMTGGVPVVWLTRETSNIATAEYIAHVKSLGLADHEIGKLGKLKYGGTARLAVQLERTNKKLMRYADFLRKAACPLSIKPLLHHTAATAWWVYLGVIPPHKIEPVDVATMRACLEWHIETHPDLATRARFKADLEQLKSLPPDARISFHMQREREWGVSARGASNHAPRARAIRLRYDLNPISEQE